MHAILKSIQAGEAYWVDLSDIEHPVVRKLFSHLLYAGGDAFSSRPCSQYNINYMRSYRYPKCVSINGRIIGTRLTPAMLITRSIFTRIQ